MWYGDQVLFRSVLEKRPAYLACVVKLTYPCFLLSLLQLQTGCYDLRQGHIHSVLNLENLKQNKRKKNKTYVDMGLSFSCPIIPAPLWQDSELFLLLKWPLLVWLCCKTIQYRVSSIFTIWKGPWRPGMYTWRIQMIKIFPFDTQQGATCHPISYHFIQSERKSEEGWSLLTPAGIVFTFFYVRPGYWLHRESLV